MEITVTKPIEEFIQRQVANGYADAGEVARQALLRWMEEEDSEFAPPQLASKIAEARAGDFRPYDPARYDDPAAALHETAR